MRIRRRSLLAGAVTTLAMPAVGRAQEQKVLRFVPQSDVAVLDPILSVSYVTRNHAMLVFDTLYGVDLANKAQPQMLAGHETSVDGLRWTLTLRPGLRFHDGAPVLARDVVASLRRWGARDNVGQVLMAATDELSASGDAQVVFRLKHPFPALPFALGKIGTNVAAIMPERLAATSPLKAVGEMIGSGPYRFRADEQVAGARLVYTRFDGYVPRQDGAVSALAGPKVAHFDRVEWVVMPDVATAAAALQRGEVDWWEQANPDYWSMLTADPGVVLDRIDPYGSAGVIRFNCTLAPTADPAVRRAGLAAISQADVMTAVSGPDRADWRDRVGFFLPGTPMASDAGMQALKEPPDREAARRMLAASSYRGETLVFLCPADFPSINAECEVVADALQKVGFRIDLQSMDWGTLQARAAKRAPVGQGGWHVTGSFTAGVGLLNPAANNFLRGSGASAIFGWPDILQLEALRDAWFRAPDEATQAALCRQIQAIAFETVPYVPTGLTYGHTAYRRGLVDVPHGLPLFYGIRRV